MNIRIHEPGERVTDPALVDLLAARTPRAFRKAQDVLVAAQKYLSKSGGFFSTERSRRRALVYELVQLGKALERDRYRPEAATMQGGYNKTAAVIEFLSEFSDAFPNWQEEYRTINRVIREL